MLAWILAAMLGFSTFIGLPSGDVNEYGQPQIYGWGNQTIDKFGNTAADRDRLAAEKLATENPATKGK
ncbi:hypothetical protein N9V65_01800 [Flavobacteriales bacterium]|nr:hypothetical protein [Flavobacteriales bacterium]